MIRIREIDHLVLRVIDLEPMLRFYCGALGCSVERRDDAIGLVQLRAGRSLIDLVPVGGTLGRAGGAAPGREARNLDHFCLRIEPFDEPAHTVLHARGSRSALATTARSPSASVAPSCGPFSKSSPTCAIWLVMCAKQSTARSPAAAKAYSAAASISTARKGASSTATSIC